MYERKLSAVKGPIMGGSANPSLLRRTKLRTARLHKELTQAQVARVMDWSLSKINPIEKAKNGIGINGPYGTSSALRCHGQGAVRGAGRFGLDRWAASVVGE